MGIKLNNCIGLITIATLSIASNANSFKPAEGGTPAPAEENKIQPWDKTAIVGDRSTQTTARSTDIISARSAQGNTLNIPGGRGTLTSNAWRSTRPSSSGNTLQWDYVVSAIYNGNVEVDKIRTTWYSSASLRNSASINLGISLSGASAGGGTGWQNVTTPTKYWENSSYKPKSSDYRSNIIISPSRDYRDGTISIINTAKVYLKGDPRPYSISSGV